MTDYLHAKMVISGALLESELGALVNALAADGCQFEGDEDDLDLSDIETGIRQCAAGSLALVVEDERARYGELPTVLGFIENCKSQLTAWHWNEGKYEIQPQITLIGLDKSALIQRSDQDCNVCAELEMLKEKADEGCSLQDVIKHLEQFSKDAAESKPLTIIPNE